MPFVAKGVGEYKIAPISAATFVEYRDAGKLIGRKSSFEGLELLIEDGTRRFFTAETSAGEVLGHVGINLLTVPSGEMKDITGERRGIGALAVAEAHRRKGIGMELTEYALGALADKGFNAFLAVEAGNKDAISLYDNIGFAKRGELYLRHDVGVGELTIWQDRLCNVMVYDQVG